MVKDNLSRFSRFLQLIRTFFYQHGFLEVMTPVSSPFLIPESYLDFFETDFFYPNGRKKKMYLTPSPELWHKRLLAKYRKSIFEISPRFRNRDYGKLHKPEFILLEWYRLGADIFTSMNETEELIKFVFQTKTISYGGKKIKFPAKFKRLSIQEAFWHFLNIKDIFDKDNLFWEARKRGLNVKQSDEWKDIFNLLYVGFVEPHLGQDEVTFIYNFPAEFAPLAKKNRKDPRFKERFELFIGGVELADGYSELTDPLEQKRAFEREIREMRKNNKKIPQVDWQFIEVLKKGLPKSSGVALGLERLFMIMLDKNSIHFCFP